MNSDRDKLGRVGLLTQICTLAAGHLVAIDVRRPRADVTFERRVEASYVLAPTGKSGSVQLRRGQFMRHFSFGKAQAEEARAAASRAPEARRRPIEVLTRGDPG